MAKCKMCDNPTDRQKRYCLEHIIERMKAASSVFKHRCRECKAPAGKTRVGRASQFCVNHQIDRKLHGRAAYFRRYYIEKIRTDFKKMEKRRRTTYMRMMGRRRIADRIRTYRI